MTAHDLAVPRLFDQDRLRSLMQERDVDGLVVHLKNNVFYLTSFAPRGAQSVEETYGASAFVLSRHRPDQSILVVVEADLDYFRHFPTWVQDVRAYRSLLAPIDGDPDLCFSRMVHPDVRSASWASNAQELYGPNLHAAIGRAVTDLGLSSSSMTVGFDDLRVAASVDIGGATSTDAYGLLRRSRQRKTSGELRLLEHAASINERAIAATVSGFQTGMTWSDVQHLYHVNAVALGGFVRDPGSFNIANPEVDLGMATSANGKEDHVVQEGASMLFDCHGSFSQYCWDGGKTWVVGGERTGMAARIQRACIEAMDLVRDRLRPGARIGDLQDAARRVFTASGIPEGDRALVFFHGMGLDHYDSEQVPGNFGSWELSEHEAIATHVYYPGSSELRFYLEDTAVVGHGGGRSLYTWSDEPIVSAGVTATEAAAAG